MCLSGGGIRSAALRPGYTCFQLLGDAMEGAKTLDDSELAGRTHAFTTIMADDIRFGENGERVASRALQVQYYQ